ncbi:MAG: hypothetical protein KDA16_13925 [Phycisphaerales bacterium]|nr:hypothetical protein [Phycisphaerales bacterium]
MIIIRALAPILGQYGDSANSVTMGGGSGSSNTSETVERAARETGTMLADTGENAIHVLNQTLRTKLDFLNHPDALTDMVTQINVVWAAIFVTIGLLCVIHGYKWHKTVILALAGMLGVWAGLTVGERIGETTVVASCMAVLFVVLAWPMLRYSVALFGGLAGAFLGANVWTALGYPAEDHHYGALIGLIVAGMLAFTAFRTVVIALTTVGGATLLTVGGLAALVHVESWRPSLIQGLESKPLLVPVLAAVIAATGAVIQAGGGFSGMNACANRADPKAKKKPAAAG